MPPSQNTGPRLTPATAIVAAVAAASVAYHLWLVFTGLMPNLISRPVHLAFALPFVFLFAGEQRAMPRLSGYAFFAIGLVGCLWIALNRDMLVDQYGALEGWWQRAVAIGLIVTVLEMARRAIKLALPAVAVVALAYGLLGQYLPGELGHPGMPVDSFLGTLTIAEGGLWGPLAGVSVNVVAVFVILGAVMSAGEGGEAFMTLAQRLAGRLKAGAAKVSVLASAFFGSISGSASANVASTGAVTLPAMRRLGYPASFAAAVEATASTGGQIMPPLMGAGAFVMAELLGRPYAEIVTAAILPALLFFFAVWIAVDRFAARYGLKAMSRDDIPAARRVLRLAPFFLVPFGLLLFVLFAMGRTAQFAAAIAIFASGALLVTDARYRPSLRRWASRLHETVVTAAGQIAVIASIILCASLVIGVLNLTGLGIKITSLIISLSGGELWAALLLTALACLVLGMEVPTTAAYVICVSVAGPALQELGLPPLLAHLFVFWYALLSTITPPVCGTVFIAAGMTGAPWMSVAGHAMRLGLGLYLVPLALVVEPALIAPGAMPAAAFAAAAKTALALWLVSRGVIAADRPWIERAAATAAGLAILFVPLSPYLAG